MSTYTCRKAYGQEQGLSAVFRQHRARSHCRLLHGYALGFAFTFGCDHVDPKGWVVDFGSLKLLKAWLGDTFDHAMLVAEDDPERSFFEMMADNNLCRLHIVPAVGCEAFARAAFEQADAVVREATMDRAWCIDCTVSEHAGNSATYRG